MYYLFVGKDNFNFLPDAYKARLLHVYTLICIFWLATKSKTPVINVKVLI